MTGVRGCNRMVQLNRKLSASVPAHVLRQRSCPPTCSSPCQVSTYLMDTLPAARAALQSSDPFS